MHSFDPVDAERYGILEAVLLANIQWWVAKNEANQRHFHDGQYWTYNSAKAFTKLFPYASQQQIQRALKRLEEAGVLLVGSYNINPYDHTKWYSVVQERINDSSNLINQKIEIDQPSNTDIKPDTVGQKSNPLFDIFWKAYPRKVNPGAAKKAFAKLKVDQSLLMTMLGAIEQQKKTDQWKDPKYIPHPSSWLNGERWSDEVQPTIGGKSAYDALLG